MKENRSDLNTFAFIAGVSVGAILTSIFVSKAGQEMRNDAMQKMHDMKLLTEQKVKNKIGHVETIIDDTISNTKKGTLKAKEDLLSAYNDDV